MAKERYEIIHELALIGFAGALVRIIDVLHNLNDKIHETEKQERQNEDYVSTEYVNNMKLLNEAAKSLKQAIDPVMRKIDEQ